MRITKKLLAFLLSAVIMISGSLALPLGTVQAQARNGSGILVALGDSYSSGEGIEPFFGQEKSVDEKINDEDWLAHRSKLAWSGLLTLDGVSGTMADNKDTKWFFVAASGALTEDFSSGQKKNYNQKGKKGTKTLTPQFEIFDKLEKGSVDIVTLTIGGNDIGFSGIIVNTLSKDEKGLKSYLEEIWKKFYAENGTRDKIKESYKLIAEKAGSQATIIVAGYPKLLNPDGFEITAFGNSLTISPEKAQMIDEACVIFNDELEKMVDECWKEGINIVFADVEGEFEGHGAYSAEPYINGIVLQAMPEDLDDTAFASAYSVHPNAKGAQAYARAVQKVIDGLKSDTEISVSVTSSAIKKAKTSISLYFNKVQLGENAFKVKGKINGKKQSVYYIPAKTVAETLGGKYSVKNNKVTVKLGTVTLSFKTGKNSYTIS